MVEGTPLVQANAEMKEIETPAPSAGASDVNPGVPAMTASQPGGATAGAATGEVSAATEPKKAQPAAAAR